MIVSRSLFPGPGRWPPPAIEVVCNSVLPLRHCCKCKWQETHKQAFSSASFLCFRILFPQNPSTDDRTISDAGCPHRLLGASVHKGQFERWRLLEESLEECLHLCHCLGEFQLLPAGGREVRFHLTGPHQGEELTAATLSHTPKREKTPEDEGQKIKVTWRF